MLWEKVISDLPPAAFTHAIALYRGHLLYVYRCDVMMRQHARIYHKFLQYHSNYKKLLQAYRCESCQGKENILNTDWLCTCSKMYFVYFFTKKVTDCSFKTLYNKNNYYNNIIIIIYTNAEFIIIIIFQKYRKIVILWNIGSNYFLSFIIFEKLNKIIKK